MKKWLFALMMFVGLTASAQFGAPGAQHLPFLGVPINGSYTEFAQQLKPQGIKYSKYLTKLLGKTDQYVMTGKYAGYKCNFYLIYNPQTQLVYSVAVGIDKKKLTDAQQVYQAFVNMVPNTFGQANVTVQEGSSPDNLKFIVYTPDRELLGNVNVSIKERNGRYTIMTTYVDADGTLEQIN